MKPVSDPLRAGAPLRGASDALLIVDLQRDFLPGGALGVSHGYAVVPVLNRYVKLAAEVGSPVFASRDWHPSDHCSFRARGGPWPDHCVAETPGAQFAADLDLPPDVHRIDKATRPDADAYSAFDGTGLAERLRKLGVDRVVIGGLATDYCVLATVRDALREGFEVVVLEDAVRAVDVHPGDGEAALRAMREAGATLVRETQAGA